MDPLSDVLRGLQISGAFLFRAELSAPWSYSVPDAAEMAAVLPGPCNRMVRFHVILRGACAFAVGEQVWQVGAGAVILQARGDAHLLSSEVGLAPVPVMSVLGGLDGSVLPCIQRPGTGPVTTILCGFLSCDEPMFDPLLSALEPTIVVSSSSPASLEWQNAMLQQVVQQAGAGPGALGMQTRLVELMFVEVLRRHVSALPEGESGWLAALRDPHVGKAVAEVHARPGQRWTVAGLARRVGVSRSVLAERFQRVLGVPPMQYLASWRLQVASRLLRRSDLSTAEVAARVGYRSEAAFHRAFKRLLGETPAGWRQRSQG